MQRNDKKIKKLLSEHIRKRPHSPSNPAGLYSGGATPSRVCRTRQGFVSCSCMFHLWQQSWVPMYSSRNCKADTAKRSMFPHIACQPHIPSSQEDSINIYSKSQWTYSCWSLSTNVLGWSHDWVFVEWRCMNRLLWHISYSDKSIKNNRCIL